MDGLPRLGGEKRASGGIQQWRGNVLFNGMLRQEVERLKDEADLLAADARKFGVVQGRDIYAVKMIRAASRTVEAAKQMQQRGFAGAGRPHNCEKFPFGNLKVNIMQRGDVQRAFMIGAFNVAERNHHHVPVKKFRAERGVSAARDGRGHVNPLFSHRFFSRALCEVGCKRIVRHPPLLRVLLTISSLTHY